MKDNSQLNLEFPILNSNGFLVIQRLLINNSKMNYLIREYMIQTTFFENTELQINVLTTLSKDTGFDEIS